MGAAERVARPEQDGMAAAQATLVDLVLAERIAEQRGVVIHDSWKDRSALRCDHGDLLPLRQSQAQVDVEVAIPVDRIEPVQLIEGLSLDAETGGGDPAHLLLNTEGCEPFEHGLLTDAATG